MTTAKTEAIQGAVEDVDRLVTVNLFPAVTAAVKELTQIAISDADQETRVRLVTEFMESLPASAR